MESHLPTRPSSDLHRRLSVRKRPPAAMETQQHALPGPTGRNRQRSSSFSALSQSLSRFMPSNRPEKGGTKRPINNESKIGDSLPQTESLMEIFEMRGRADEIEDAGEEMRRTKSWSPKRIARNADERDGESHRPSKLKKPSTLKRLWELHRAAKDDDGTNNFSQRSDRFCSHAQGLRWAEQNILNTSLTDQKKPSEHSNPGAVDIQDSVAALKRSLQMFEEKKSRREDRRSFRESDDFIGVQGANPRTGYPDPSTGTSSSAGDIVSESTRRKLEEDERRMATASREYKAALERRENEMRRLEMEREKRRREKRVRVEKKRAQLRARVKKAGRWRNNGNTWSMVTEPELSPIVQSIAGSPTHETIPPHRVLTTPITANVESVARLGARIEDEYFHRIPLPPKTPERYHKPYLESASQTPTGWKDPSDRIETASEKAQPNCLPVQADSLYGNGQETPTPTAQSIKLPIRRKEVAMATLRRRASSSETVIHNIEIEQALPVELTDNRRLAIAVTPPSVTPRLQVTTPGETIHKFPLTSPSMGEEPFLDLLRTPSECEGQQENEAIVASYQSTLINQVLTHLPSPKNPKDTFQANLIYSLKEFPPVVLKDPISARIPSNPQSQRTPLPLPVLKFIPRLPQQDLRNPVQGTITPITTTTGFVGLPRPLSKLDGFKDANEDRLSPQRPTMANYRISIPNFRPKEMPNGTPNSGSQMNQADIATLSARHPPVFSTVKKRPIPELCQPASPKLEKMGPVNTLQSTFTAPQRQSPSPQYAAAQSAAQAAFLGASPRHLGKEVKARSSSLVSPRSRTKEVAERSCQGRKMFSGGSVDIGDLFRTHEELEKEKNPQLLRSRIEQAKQLGGPSTNEGEDGFIVWCNDVEKKKVRFANEKLPAGQKKIPQSLANKKLKGTQNLPSKKSKDPVKGIAKLSLLRKTYEMMMWSAGTAWWFVSPVFNPRSSLRWRWGRNQLVWQDILLIGAAGIFGGGAFLTMVLLAKLLGVGLQVVKVCIQVCKVLAQL